jgi:hypothetical protein
MKLNGVRLECPNIAVLVLPRPDGDIVFKAQAVLDFDEFEKICPPPTPPVRVVKGRREVMASDPEYIKQLNAHNEKRMAWIILKSLEATEGLEWETVNMNDPETYTNYVQELKDAKFSVVEINKIVMLALQANALDEAKLEAARQAFLAGQGKE